MKESRKELSLEQLNQVNGAGDEPQYNFESEEDRKRTEAILKKKRASSKKPARRSVDGFLLPLEEGRSSGRSLVDDSFPRPKIGE